MTGSQGDKISQQQVSDIINKCGGEHLEHCRTCEDCVSTCFLTNTYPGMTPRDIPRGLIDGRVQELVDSEFIWACTLCSRCVVDCPEKIHMDKIVRSLRGLARQQGKGPKRLEEGLAKIKEVGNSVGIDSEEFVDSVEWLGEELADEIEGIDADEFTIPVDKEGAEILYIPNPREFTSAPRMFSVYIKFLLTTGADWTFASNICDISNWAYYMGDDETNAKLIRNVVDTARHLGVKTLVTTECGHGFKILRNDAEELLGEPWALRWYPLLSWLTDVSRMDAYVWLRALWRRE
jgi:Fe-S oxidoreductase